MVQPRGRHKGVDHNSGLLEASVWGAEQKIIPHTFHWFVSSLELVLNDCLFLVGWPGRMNVWMAGQDECLGVLL